VPVLCGAITGLCPADIAASTARLGSDAVGALILLGILSSAITM